MKVISKTEHGYLVEASQDELRSLSGNTELGYNGVYSDNGIDLGTEIEIIKIYMQACNLKCHLDEITTAQIMLRKIANNIEPIKPIIEKIITPVTTTDRTE